MQSPLPDEGLLRAGFFLGALLVLALCETLWPRLPRPALRRLRWPGNLGLVLVSTALIRALSLVLPVLPVGLAVGLAVWAQGRGWGLLNALPLPEWAAGLAAILLLDCAIYWQHRASHAWRWFWRLHRVHHSTDLGEANRNFGFCFPWWDRLFASYQDQPKLGHEGMAIGLGIFRDHFWAGLWGLLRMPFR